MQFILKGMWKPDKCNLLHYIFGSKLNMYKTEVINDPLGQPTVLAGSDCRLILKF